MADSYPSLGIRIDLNEIAAGAAALNNLKRAYGEVGAAAGQAAQAATTRAQASTRAAQQEQVAIDQTFQFQRRMTAQHIAENTAANARIISDFQRMAAQKQAAAATVAREEQRLAEQTFNFQRRMTQQRVDEAARASTAITSAANRAGADQRRVDQQVFDFQRRMTAQRIAEAQRTAAEEVRTQEQAAARLRAIADRATADFRAAMDRRIAAGRAAADAQMAMDRQTFEFQRRMTAQRGREASSTQAAQWTSLGPLGGVGARAAAAEVSGLTAVMSGLQGALGRVGSALGSLRTGLANLGSAFFDVRLLVAAFMGALVVGPIVQAADAMRSLEARTALYAARASDIPYTFEQIYRTAQATRTPLEAVATLYTRLAPLAEQLGRNQTQILRTVQTVSEAFQIGGATPAEARSSSQQLAQALASNRLGGDELRSLAENAPVLVARIAAALNMNVGQFINWAHAGHANTRVMVEAIDRAQSDIDRMFRTLPTTIGQATTLVGNAFQHLVGEADRATNASLEVAAHIAQFSRFLESEQALNTVIAAIHGIGTAFSVAGVAIQTFVAYAPAVGAMIVAIAGARIIPAILRAAAVEMTAFNLALGYSGGGAANAFAIGMGRAGQAAAGLGRGLSSLISFLGGPLGIALIAATAAFSYFADEQRRSAAVTQDFQNANQTAVAALQQADSFAQRYGVSTAGLTSAMNSLVGANDNATTSTNNKATADDTAMQAALARANVERVLTAQLLEQAAASEAAAAAAAGRSIGSRTFQRLYGRAEIGFAGDNTPEHREATARYNATLAQDRADEQTRMNAVLNAVTLTNQAAIMRSVPLTVTAPAAGSGHVTTTPPTGHNRGPTSGGLNAVARMREEVEGLNAQIAALNTDPLSDFQARIRTAADTARASREFGRNSPLADQAAGLAALREEAQIRLELTRALVQQQRADIQAAQASDVALQASHDQAQELQNFYVSGQATVEGYAAALDRQHQIQLDAQTSQAALTIAQQFGVTSLDQIAGAYQRATGATDAQASAVQRQAEATYAQRVATIQAADAQQRLTDANARTSEVDAQSDATLRYSQALQQGTLALAEFNRQQAIREELRAHPGLGLQGATSIVNAQTIGTETQRTAEMAEQDRLAASTTRSREQEARVQQIIVAQLALASNENRVLSDTDKARLETQARITAELEAQRRGIAALKTAIQDDIRQAFIETGRLDFGPLRQRLTQELRRAVYDALIARPITIVVNAVVDVVTRGLSRILDQIVNGVNGQGNGILGQIGQLFSGSGGGGLGSIFNTAQAGTAAAHEAAHAITGAASALQTIGTTLVAAYAGYQLGTAAAGALGVDMANPGAGIGGMVGGGVGAVAGFILGGPIGSAIGAAIGSGIGAWLGTAINGPYDPSATTSIRMVGGKFTPQTVKVDDDGPGAEVTQLAGTVATAMTAAANTFGVNIAKLGTFSTAIGYTATDRKGYTKGFFGGFVPGTSYGSTSEQIRAGVYAGGAQYAGITDPQELATLLVKDMLAEAARSGAIDLTEAELALIKAADNLDDAANTIKAARDLSRGISQGLLRYTNPRQAALNDLFGQQVARRQQIQGYAAQGLITMDRLTQINTDLTSLERYEIADVVAQFGTAVGEATHSLQDFRDVQGQIKNWVTTLATSSLSPLSPQDQLTAAGNSFFSTLNSARGGNYNSLSSLTDVAQTYLTQAQGYYGSSSAYDAVYSSVVSALSAVADQSLVDPNTQAITDALAQLQDAVSAAGADIVGAINDNGTGAAGITTVALTDDQIQSLITSLGYVAASNIAGADRMSQFVAQAVAVGGAMQGGQLGYL